MPFGKWLALGFTLLPQVLLNQRSRSFRYGNRGRLQKLSATRLLD